MCALTVVAMTHVSGEAPRRVRLRAYVLLATLTLLETALTGALLGSAVLTALVLLGFRARRRRTFLCFAALVPGLLLTLVVSLAFTGEPVAQRVVETYNAEAEIRRGTLVYVERWGFVDVTHAHPGPYEDALVAITRGEQRVRLYVELIDAHGDIHVVERVFEWSSGADATWALAAAMTLDLERAAEQVQARAPWHRGFAISAYAPHDLPSNLFGVLYAAGRLSPRTVERDRALTLARYRAQEDEARHARVMGYVLPRDATSREHRDFRAIQRAERALRKGPVRSYVHPASRRASGLFG